jgi:hypothetical protein
MKTIGLVLLVLGLLLAAAGPLAMWWSYHSVAVMSETPQPSDVAKRVSNATTLVPGIPIGIALAIAGLALFLAALFSRDSKSKPLPPENVSEGH